jgi:hypothetical protein
MGCYLYHKVHIFVMETIDFLSISDPAVKIFNFLFTYLLLVQLFGQPLANKGLRFFQRHGIRIVDEYGQFGYSVGNDGDAGAHLACPNHSERFNVCEPEERSIDHSI